MALRPALVDVGDMQIKALMFWIFVCAPEHGRTRVAHSYLWQKQIEKGVENDCKSQCSIKHQRLILPDVVNPYKSTNQDYAQPQVAIEVLLDIERPFPAARTTVDDIILKDRV
jgi:hypothetical protein